MLFRARLNYNTIFATTCPTGLTLQIIKLRLTIIMNYSYGNCIKVTLATALFFPISVQPGSMVELNFSPTILIFCTKFYVRIINKNNVYSHILSNTERIRVAICLLQTCITCNYRYLCTEKSRDNK